MLQMLVIEDNPGDQRLIREYLYDAGRTEITADFAATLAEGKRLLAERRYRIVVLDLNLPDSGEGDKTLDSILQIANGIPVVVMTGISDEEYGLSLISKGAQDFIVKGQVNGSGFLRALRHAMERARLIDELNHIRADLELSQHISHLGGWELNLETHMISLSKEAALILGLSRQPQLKMPLADFITQFSEQDGARLLDEMQSGITAAQPFKMRLEMRPGHPVNAVQLITFCDQHHDHHTSHIYGTIQDISDFEKLEAQLRQAQKMEAIGTLVGGIAHDFNNKLAAITGHLFLAQKEKQSQKHLQMAQALCFEAAELIKSLLAFSRNDDVEKRVFSINSFLKEAIKNHRVLLPENISLNLDIEERDMLVYGSLVQAQQVLINLLNNARDAVEESESPAISVGLYYFIPDSEFRDFHHTHAHGEWAHLQVSDNGCGITREHLPQIFDPFFTSKGIGKGTGLGLSMVYKVIESMDGIIDVESEPGLGSRFDIYLPLTAREQEAVQEIHETVASTLHQGILLVDDDAPIRNAICTVLNQLGYRMYCAEDGIEAIEKYREFQSCIDLVLMDIVMPRLSGDEAYRRLCDINPAIRVIFMSGYDQKQSMKHLAMEGITLIAKPFSIAQLSQTIAAELGRAEPSSQP
ncbi:response regulator [Mariprofundus erugo]|uniref:histidine kinase n=1 Tax=Mariprofundus erugo TaxID=2528639 RepID=A0A5R9GIB1_9PROT|nr:response regulator [Mariprofundus erugo]TLS65638.1 response regulator [Mariprofundus erugo]